MKEVRLTQLSAKGGCAAKWAPGDLKDVLAPIMSFTDENLLQGFDTSDDAAIYRINETQAAVLTVDFLTPLVDDPYDYGKLAAANAISDVFAMGGKPICALNILALDCALGAEVAGEILRGGADVAKEAGIIVVGGHSIDDNEPKYGLAVFGLIDPEKVVCNGGALPGDFLYLTKPLGTGCMSAGYKIGILDEQSFRPVIDSMQALNRDAAEAMLTADVHAATDVTGFGLAGHLHEMVEASNCGVVIDYDALPLFDQVKELIAAWCRPNRTFSIMDYARPFVNVEGLNDEEVDERMSVICDPQTSGGLLVAIDPEKASLFEEEFQKRSGRVPARIGVFTAENPGMISFK